MGDYLSTKQAAKKIVDLYTSGTSAREIARRMDTDHQRVVRILRAAGVEILRGRRPVHMTDQLKAAIVMSYAEGTPAESIASGFGLTTSYVLTKLKEWDVPRRAAGFQRGSAHHAWVGGKLETGGGYIRVRVYPEDPFYSMAVHEYVLEHRLVMARHLNRVLTDEETVHHIDGDRTNNAIENLQLRQGKHGNGVAMRCADCGSHNVEAVQLAPN